MEETPIVGQEFANWIPVNHQEERIITEIDTILEYLQWIEKNMGPRSLLHFGEDLTEISAILCDVIREAQALRAQ